MAHRWIKATEYFCISLSLCVGIYLFSELHHARMEMANISRELGAIYLEMGDIYSEVRLLEISRDEIVGMYGTLRRDLYSEWAKGIRPAK